MSQKEGLIQCHVATVSTTAAKLTLHVYVHWRCLPDMVRSSLWMRERLADSISGLGLSRAWRHHTIGLKAFCRGLFSFASYSLEQKTWTAYTIDTRVHKSNISNCYTNINTNGERHTYLISCVMWLSSSQRKWDWGDKCLNSAMAIRCIGRKVFMWHAFWHWKLLFVLIQIYFIHTYLKSWGPLII